ncbi:MAG: tryptophan--tRNA ligase [Mucinivorans sp.]
MAYKVVSGIRSTGNLHLGNYFGALVNFIEMQKTDECLFFIADYHSLTTHPDPKMLGVNVRNVLSEYLGAGLDPERSAIYIQSDLPQVAELYLLLSMHAPVGDLERTVSFKEKVRAQEDNVNAGLLTYPVLMAADILIHRADRVPVGKDQEQHMEMTRRYARKFNAVYGVEYFKEPESYNFGRELVKVPGLDGMGKMGKSTGNGLYLIDTDKDIEKKVMRAVTDSGPVTPNSQPSEPIANIFQIMSLVSDESTLAHFKAAYADCSIRYGELKKQLAEDLIKTIAPIRERILDIRANDDYMRQVARHGAQRARESANATINDVRRIMGLGSL